MTDQPVTGTVPPDLRQAIMVALALTITGEKEALAGELAGIAGWGPRGVFTAISGWSAITLKAMTGSAAPDDSSFYELEVTDRRTGKPASIAEVGDRNQRAAAQMVSLYGNGDTGTMIALVDAAFGEDRGTGLMAHSLVLAAQAARKLKEEEAGD